MKALTQPIRTYKKVAILDIFIEIFNVPIFLDGGGEGGYMLSGVVGQSDNLLNNYVALLLQSFHYSGAYDQLVDLGVETDEGSQLNK